MCGGSPKPDELFPLHSSSYKSPFYENVRLKTDQNLRTFEEPTETERRRKTLFRILHKITETSFFLSNIVQQGSSQFGKVYLCFRLVLYEYKLKLHTQY